MARRDTVPSRGSSSPPAGARRAFRALVLTLALVGQIGAVTQVGAGLQMPPEAAPREGVAPTGSPQIATGNIPVTVDSWLSEFAGQPPPGTVIWGAAVGENDDPTARHETPAGKPLGVRRTYYQWRHLASGYLASIVSNDVAAGRLPWISIKPPAWADVATGAYDGSIDALLTMLSNIPGDVWLTFHHEPEGGGGINLADDASGPGGHVAMNRRVRERMTLLGVTNVALAPILMSWTWDPESSRNPEEWWDPTVYDFLGVDHYVCSDDNISCRTAGLADSVWYSVRDWAAVKGVEIAVGEWGMRGTDQSAGDRVLDWYLQAIDSATDGRGARVVGMAAFDSSADPTTPSWELQGAQLETFQRLLADNRSTGPNTHRSSPLLWWVPVLCAPWLALRSRRSSRHSRRTINRTRAAPR